MATNVFEQLKQRTQQPQQKQQTQKPTQNINVFESLKQKAQSGGAPVQSADVSQETPDPTAGDNFAQKYIFPSTTDFSRQISEAEFVRNSADDLLKTQDEVVTKFIQRKREGASEKELDAYIDQIEQIRQRLTQSAETLDKTPLQQAGTALGVGVELAGVAELPLLLRGLGTGAFRAGKALLGVGGREVAERAPSALSRPIMSVGGQRSNVFTQALGKADDLTAVRPLSQAQRDALQTAGAGAKLGQIAKDTAKLGVEGGAFGYGFDVSENLKAGETGADAFTPGAGTAFGVGLPAGIGGLRVATLPLNSMVRAGRSFTKPSKELIEQEQNRLKNAYDDVFKQRESTTRKLEFQKRYGKDPSEILSRYGIIPELEYTNGKTIMKTTGEPMDRVNDMIQKRALAIQDTLERIDAKSGGKTNTSINKLEKQALDRAERSLSGLELKSKQNKIRSEFESLRLKYGDEINASQMNRERIAANEATKAFNREKFEQDAFNIIGDVMRRNIDNVVGDKSVRNVNAQIGELLSAREMLRNLDGKGIGAGRFTNIIASSAASLLGAMAGGGNIVTQVLSSVASMVGIKMLLRMIANGKFGGSVTRRILQHLQDNPEVVQQLLQGESRATKRLFMNEIEKQSKNLLPAPAEGSPRFRRESGPTINLGRRSQSTIDAQEVANIQNPRSIQTPMQRQSINDITNPNAIDNSIQGNQAVGNTNFGLPAPRGNVRAGETIRLPESARRQNLGLDEVKNARMRNPSDRRRNINTEAFGAFAGIEVDEDGNISFSPEKAGLGVLGVAGSTRSMKKFNTKNITTKILQGLKGKSTVSKQFILDATNQGSIRQPERELIREVAETMPEGKIDVKEFTNKVKAQLLPLKTGEMTPAINNAPSDFDGIPGTQAIRYENVALPDDVRGNVANYGERIYESPIKTSAGDIHFSSQEFPNYFAHSRIEDMAGTDGVKMLSGPKQGTRRVIEIQSDLFQKGRLENEIPYMETEAAKRRSAGEDIPSYATYLKRFDRRSEELSKLQPYRNTWHERIIREEIARAAKDGKKRLLFPTGETAMKIEGLSQRDLWKRLTPEGKFVAEGSENFLTPENIKEGQRILRGNNDDWVILDNLGEGKFIAAPTEDFLDMAKSSNDPLTRKKSLRELVNDNEYIQDYYDVSNRAEEFDVSGKIDKSNPIYRFYEKDVQKFLRNFDGKPIVDENGVSWIEVPINKIQAKEPVLAFGGAQVGPILSIGAGAAGIVGATALGRIPSDPITYQRSEEPQSQQPQVTPKEIEIEEPTPENTISNVNLANYATDPTHIPKIRDIYNDMQDVSTPEKAQKEIDRVAENSPITGQMIIEVSNEFGIDPKLLLSLLRQESDVGTSDLARETNNPGSILLTDDGGKYHYPTMKEGLRATARELFRRKVNQ